MKKKIITPVVAVVAALALAGVASATVTFDPNTGTGFVGKGDVQLVYSWNNAQLQNNAGLVQFQYSATTVSEQTWECTNSNNEHVQERLDTTTTSTQGLVDSVARTHNQVDGFNLLGYNTTTPPTTSSSTDGPPLNSCPAIPSTYYLSSPAGDPVVVSSTGGLQVSTDGSTWNPIG